MPPQPDSSDIDAAVIARLQTDPELTTLLPDGVWMDEAPPGLRRFVIVTIMFAPDVGAFQQRAIEDVRYAITARALSTAGANMKRAAARIDELLEDAQLTVAGYGWMDCAREERIRRTEVDAV